MKLVIDIPEDVYTRLFDNGIQDNEIAVDDVCEMARAIRLGKPHETVTEFADRCRECGKQKRGHWILTDAEEEIYCHVAICSVCGRESINEGVDEYCSCCGARMEV